MAANGGFILVRHYVRIFQCTIGDLFPLDITCACRLQFFDYIKSLKRVKRLKVAHGLLYLLKRHLKRADAGGSGAGLLDCTELPAST